MRNEMPEIRNTMHYHSELYKVCIDFHKGIHFRTVVISQMFSFSKDINRSRIIITLLAYIPKNLFLT